jgi:hypothetical protein
VQTPQDEQVGDRPAADPDEVGATEPVLGIGRGLGEEAQLGDVTARRVERLVGGGVGVVGVAGGGVDETDPGANLVGHRERVEEHRA